MEGKCNITYKMNYIEKMILVLPFICIGDGDIFIIARIIFAVVLLYELFRNNYLLIEKADLLFILFFGVYFFYSSTHLKSLPSALIIFEIYYYIKWRDFSIEMNSDFLYNFGFSCFIAASISMAVMYFSNTLITGGDYNNNTLGVSNLTVPCLFGVYMTSMSIDIYSQKRISKLHVLSFAFIIISLLVLDKRGPIIFPFISILLAYSIRANSLRNLLLLVIFLYPIYELFLVDYFIDNVLSIFPGNTIRMNDFEDIEKNPRIIRLILSQEFITDFNFRDLIGYHKIIDMADDRAHNHFHNLFLQLYYERGALSVLFIICTIVAQLKYKMDNINIDSRPFVVLLFLMLIGTNESILKSMSGIEIIFFVFLFYYIFYNKQMDSSFS